MTKSIIIVDLDDATLPPVIYFGQYRPNEHRQYTATRARVRRLCELLGPGQLRVTHWPIEHYCGRSIGRTYSWFLY